MIDLVTIMQNPDLLIQSGFKMESDDEEIEDNDNKYQGGSVSQYTLRISDLGRRKN